MSEEKGSALLQRLIQQCGQNSLDERKAVWKVLDRTLTKAGSNDDVITKLKLTETLSEQCKDTAHGSDKVKYSEGKNLSKDDKSAVFTLHKENFTIGQVPEDWSRSYFKPILKSRQGPWQAERIPYPVNADYHGKADGMDRIQEACSGTGKEKRTSAKPRRVQSRKATLEQPDSYMSMKDSRRKNKLWP